MTTATANPTEQPTKRSETNYEVGIRNGLLEPKHYRAMGDAVWLYMYLVDKQGKQVDENGFGKVARSMPLRDEDIAGTFGCERKTVRRWRKILICGGYIMAKRAPHGCIYAVTKPKKWKVPTQTDGTQTAHHSPLVMGQERPSDGTQMAQRWDITGTCNISNKATAAASRTTAAATVPQNQMEEELRRAWDYYLNAFDKDGLPNPSEKKMAMAIISRLHDTPVSDPAQEMAFAIDMAHHIVKTQPKKSYLSKWSSIFHKWSTFSSLHSQCRDEEPPAAATLENQGGAKDE
jgi:hypothetical protein